MTMTRKHLTGLIILLLAVFCLLLGLTACGSREEPAKESQTQEPKTTASEVTLACGFDPIVLDDWKIEVNGFSFTDRIVLSDIISYEAKDSEIYAVISLRITNNAAVERIFLPVFDISGDHYLRAEFLTDGRTSPYAVMTGYEKTVCSAAFRAGECRDGTLVYVLNKGTETGSQSLQLVFNEISDLDIKEASEKVQESIRVTFR